MASDFSYDPVTAITEAEATGQLADIFADIRATMGIPLVTSIWRGLAGMDDSLPQAWAAAKPIFESGEPERGLARIVKTVELPQPLPLVPAQLACLEVSDDDLVDIRTIIAAYNRSNGMNLVALAALIAEPDGNAVEHGPSDARSWSTLPPLMAQPDIDPDVWAMIRHVNRLGAVSLDSSVATLWRHLAHWPGLLALIYGVFAPFQSNGRIEKANTQMVALAAEEGSRMAHLRASSEVSPQARDTIDGYSSSPTQVARMVTMGHALARWLGE